MELQVLDNEDDARFEIRAGGKVVGFLQYRLGDKEISFLHAETDDDFRGKGIGARLVQASLDAVRDRGLAVLPYCPFVRGWLAEHPDYVDLVPVDRRPDFGL